MVSYNNEEDAITRSTWAIIKGATTKALHQEGISYNRCNWVFQRIKWWMSASSHTQTTNKVRA